MASFARAAAPPSATSQEHQQKTKQLTDPTERSSPTPAVVPTQTLPTTAPPSTSTNGTVDMTMFAGMSTAQSTPTPRPAATTHTKVVDVPTTPVQPAQPAQPASPTPTPTPATPVSPKKIPPAAPPAPVEVCSTIKELANEVISSYETQARDLAAEASYLSEEERSMQAELEKEEISSRMLQQKVEETEVEQAAFADAEDFESADALSTEVWLVCV